MSHCAFESTRRDPDPGRGWRLFRLQKEKNAQVHRKGRRGWSRSLETDAAFYEQEKETTEQNLGNKRPVRG